jgi:hypothetical protein
MSLILMTSYMVIARKRTREMVVFKAAEHLPHRRSYHADRGHFYAMTGAAIGLALGRLLMQIIIQNLALFCQLFRVPFWEFCGKRFIAAGVTHLFNHWYPLSASADKRYKSFFQSPRIAGSRGRLVSYCDSMCGRAACRYVFS